MDRYWMKGVEVLKPASRTATTTTSDAIDLALLDGIPVLALHADAASAGTSPTLDGKVTQCDTSDGTFADSGITFTQVTTAAALQLRALDLTVLLRYVKLVLTIGGSDTPTFLTQAEIVAFKLKSVTVPVIPLVPTVRTVVKANQYSADAAAAGVDCLALKGQAVAAISVNAISGTLPTCDIKLQECATENGTYTDVPGGAFTQVTTVDGDQGIVIDLSARKRWLGFDINLGGTTPVYGIYAVILGQ